MTCLLALSLSGCGDNKTKEKLIGTTMYDSNTVTGGITTTVLPATPEASVSGMAQLSAGMMSNVITAGATPVNFGGTPISLLAPQQTGQAPSSKRIPSLGSDGYWDFSEYYTGLKVQFLDANQVPKTALDITSPWIRVKFAVTYSYGLFTGEFLCNQIVSPKVLSGTIIAPDPLGGTFTATLTDITYQMTGSVGMPVSGSMTLSSSSGYTGTFVFASTAGTSTCTGTITNAGSTVATVSLTFNATAGKYTGSYVDNTGVHALE